MSRKTLVKFAPLALTALVGTAFADDTSVTLYGILDVGIATIDKSLNASDTFPVTADNVSVYPADKVHRLTTMVNGPMSDSRWGIKGQEDLGGGMKAFFNLESGFNLPTGQSNNAALSQVQGANGGGNINADSSLSGQLFSRAANVGLSDSSLGAVSFGRNYAPGYDVIGAYDPQKGSQLFSPLGFSGSYGGALGYTEELRDDNSIRYTNSIDGVTVRALYKFGGIAGNNTAGRGMGLNLGYEADVWGVQAVYQTYKDVLATSGALFSASNPQGISGKLYDTSGFMLTGRYTWQALTLKAGYEDYKRKSSSDSAASLGGITEFGYTFAYSTVVGHLNNLTAYTGADKKYKVYWFGGDYAFTPTTDLALAYYQVKLDAATDVKDSDQKWVSLVLDHNLSKRTDVYAGYDHQSIGGTAYATGYPSGVNTLAVGMRHRF
jgi:predicted porin